jgi:transposase-like protein
MFPDDNAVKKAVYLAIQNSFIRSQQRISNWTIIANQFLILYPDRVKINYLPLRS